MNYKEIAAIWDKSIKDYSVPAGDVAYLIWVIIMTTMMSLWLSSEIKKPVRKPLF